MYYYELIWKLTKKPAYLKYAKLHAKILLKHLQRPCTEDLIYGGSGALIALVHLYKMSGEERYLKGAEEFALRIMEQAQRDEAGIWWNTNRNGGLAGMAHGNSGVGLAFSMLASAGCEKTKDYRETEKQLRQYENRFFLKEKSNWMDMRALSGIMPSGVSQSIDLEKGEDPVSWCHGAAGIALERKWVEKLLNVKCEDEQCAYMKVKNCGWKDANCLCHGNAGNLMVLMEFENIKCGKHWEKLAELVVTEQIQRKEWHNPGLMTGMAGIGYALLKAKTDNLPNILACMI